MATEPYSDAVHLALEGAKGLAAHAMEALKPELARMELAETLYDVMEHLDPTEDGGTEWADLTEHQRVFYTTCIDRLLADKHLVAAAIGASFMVPVPVWSTDAELLAAYQRTDGEPGNPEADALLAEIEQRGLDL